MQRRGRQNRLEKADKERVPCDEDDDEQDFYTIIFPKHFLLYTPADLNEDVPSFVCERRG